MVFKCSSQLSEYGIAQTAILLDNFLPICSRSNWYDVPGIHVAKQVRSYEGLVFQAGVVYNEGKIY